MSKSYFNTNSERGHQLKASEAKAAKQNEIVLTVFKRNLKRGLTAWELYLRLWGTGAPESSMRRACTTLCDQGKLKETGRLRMGGYKRLNRVYKLKTK